MEIKTSELNGAALDWAVMTILYPVNSLEFFVQRHSGGKSHYSSDWAQGGPIIEREGLQLGINLTGWVSSKYVENVAGYGPSPLVAAMRCYVASKLGEEVEVPEELL